MQSFFARQGIAMKLTVNGSVHVIPDIDPEMPLLWAIRDMLGLTGTKFGCGAALCGACTVHIDGQPKRSCAVSVSSVAHADIVTIEAVSGKVADAVKASWVRHDVPQCGYCQSGQIMSAVALLREIPNPTHLDVSQAMSGNLCRCGSYPRIRIAIADASKSLA
jgi:isoquinoline 1-oxidoreductase alpha subunit